MFAQLFYMLINCPEVDDDTYIEGECNQGEDSERDWEVLSVPSEQPGDVEYEVDGVGSQEGRGDDGGVQVHL